MFVFLLTALNTYLYDHLVSQFDLNSHQTEQQTHKKRFKRRAINMFLHLCLLRRITTTVCGDECSGTEIERFDHCTNTRLVMPCHSWNDQSTTATPAVRNAVPSQPDEVRYGRFCLWTNTPSQRKRVDLTTALKGTRTMPDYRDDDLAVAANYFTDFTKASMSKAQLAWVSTGLTPYNALYLN